MKIIVITNGFQYDYEINYTNALAKNMEEVILVGGDNYEVQKLDPKIQFHNLRGSHNEQASFFRKTIRIIKYYFSLYSFVRKSKTKLLHVLWTRFSFTEGIILTLLFRISRKTCMYTVHDILPHDRGSRMNRYIFYLVYRLQNLLVVHTNYIKERLIKEFGIKEAKIYLFKHGVYQIHQHPEINQLTTRHEFGFKADDLVLLFYGAISKYKGLDLLLDSFLLLEREIKNVKLIVAGKVNPLYEAEFRSLNNKVSSPNVYIFEGYQNDLRTEKYFKTASVTILPYYEASQSGVLFLSYAYGVPVIAPRLGGFPSDIVENETGLLFKKGDIGSLQNTIARFIDQFQKNEISSRDQIRKFAEKHYSWDLETKKLIKYCQEKDLLS